MLNKIGYITSIDWDGLLEELKPLDREERVKRYFTNHIYKIQGYKLCDDGTAYGLTISKCDNLLTGSIYDRNAEECYNTSKLVVDAVKKAEKHNKLFNIRFEVLYEDDLFIAFMYSSGAGVILPKQYVTYEKAPDYSSLTYSQIESKLIASEQKSNAVSTLNDKNQKQLTSELEKTQQALEEAEKKAKQELEAFQQEMYKQEQALRAKQEQMLSEYRTKMEAMKDQIYMLEMNILALRSYFGETFSIAHVMKGKNAPDNQPLVLFQKFRYMDEDLSRLSANSDYSTSSGGIQYMFENYGELFIETFCPNDKCITFFKASKDNKYLSYDKQEDAISEFEYFHGNQIGMLLRNGTNLYIAFIDEEIMLQDNLFISESSKGSEPVIKIGETKIRDKEVRPAINRKHIFIILQAILRLTNIYPTLKDEKIFESKRIIFSNADAQIASNKYPTFSSFFYDYNGRNSNIIVGDTIFIDRSHAGSKTESNYFGSGYHEEHRGRGYRNTARDSSIKEGINKLSIVERQQNGYDCYYMQGEFKYRVHKYDSLESLQKENRYIEIVPHRDVDYFVSCERHVDEYDYRRYDPWSRTYDTQKKFNNANLKLWEDEFMSIMWCNSNYVQQWIDTKDSANGLNYVYFVKNLKALKDYLLDREAHEFSNINKFIPFENIPSNKDIVLEWRKEHNIRILTEFQAKRFAKWYKEKNK